MKQYEKDIQAVFDLLISDPFEGTEWDLGRSAGIGTRVHGVLNRVRDPKWVDDHHWTIPYVVRGGDTNTWRVVDTLDHADNQTMRTSQYRRAAEMLQTTRRNIAQAELALVVLPDKRTVGAKQWTRVLNLQRAAESSLEMLVEGANGN
jgi:hypothetical protein